MGNIAVRVENLGKQYFIGGKKEQRVSLVDSITGAFKDPFRRLKGRIDHRESGDTKPFWALRDVSFELRHGDVLGIIGRNGSGKSTLLKIVSNVLDPTTGQVELYGRVGSLLEVGMGFHPELTGRENIYLSGAVMGMKKAEIDRKLDAIIDFSGIEEFIDTPVKRYSSGMYVRLAFSVASQLDPEILVLDEVLAVGDQVFQKKCLRKMQQVATDGRTVLFVSHGMPSVRQLCTLGILLADGLVVKEGTADEVVDDYLDIIDESLKEFTSVETLDSVPRLIAGIPPDTVFRLKDIAVLQNGVPTLNICNGEPALASIEYEVLEETPGLYVFFSLYNSQGTLLFESLHNGDEPELPVVKPGAYTSTAVIPADFLVPERHELWVGAAIHGVRNCLPQMIKFNLEVKRTGSVNSGYPKRRLKGEIAPRIKWTTDTDDGIPLRIQDLQEVQSVLASLKRDPVFRLVDVTVSQDGIPGLNLSCRAPVEIRFLYALLEESTGLYIHLRLSHPSGALLFESRQYTEGQWFAPAEPGVYSATAVIPGQILAPMECELAIGAAICDVRECLPTLVKLRLRLYDREPGHVVGSTGAPLIAPRLEWGTKTIQTDGRDRHDSWYLRQLQSVGLCLDRGVPSYGHATATSPEEPKTSRGPHIALKPSTNAAYMDLREGANRWPGYRKKILTWVSTHKLDGELSTRFNTGDGMLIRIGYHLDEELSAYCHINFLGGEKGSVMVVANFHNGPTLELHGEGFLECRIHDVRLKSGRYFLWLSIGRDEGDEKEWIDYVVDTIAIYVDIGDYLGGNELSELQGTFAQQSEWRDFSEATPDSSSQAG